MRGKWHDHDGHVRIYLKRKRQVGYRLAFCEEAGRQYKAKPRLCAELSEIERLVRERQRRREYKKVTRAKRAAMTRLHDAHVKARPKQPKLDTRDHDAHVRTWKRCDGAAWFRHRYRTDPVFNSQQKLRSMLRKVASLDGEVAAYLSSRVKAGATFSAAWKDLISYDAQQLTHRLMATMPSGYEWADFLSGELEIDHIRPRASFDLTKLSEVRECWALDNLQLLTRAENRRKGMKYAGPYHEQAKRVRNDRSFALVASDGICQHSCLKRGCQP